MSEAIPSSLSESTQMYLVTIARLRAGGRPVPLPQLAETLSVSPVSANEMSHRLQAEGLIIYRPYRGASLTGEGERRATHILRRHRLWEVFLVDWLGFDSERAHEAACQLEHTTPDQVADRLDAFLEYPSVNPEGEPIPREGGGLPSRVLVPLATLPAGQRAILVRREVSDAVRTFLNERGVRPGVGLTVVATAENSILVQVDDSHLTLARSLAESIQLETEGTEEAGDDVRGPSRQPGPIVVQTKTDTAARQTPLQRLKKGWNGVVARVGGQGLRDDG